MPNPSRQGFVPLSPTSRYEIATLLGVSFSEVDFRTPADHVAQEGEVRIRQQAWHQDQNGEPFLIAIWSNYPSELRVRETKVEVILLPLYVYVFTNADFEHRQPHLTDEQLAHRFFARVQKGA